MSRAHPKIYQENPPARGEAQLLPALDVFTYALPEESKDGSIFKHAISVLDVAALLLDRKVLRTEMEGLSEVLIGLLRDLRSNLLDEGFNEVTADRACFLLACALDEALAYSPYKSAIAQDETICYHLYKVKDGGSRFFRIVKNALHDPEENLELLKIALAVIQFGFVGEYKVRQDNITALSNIIKSNISVYFTPPEIHLDYKIPKPNPTRHPRLALLYGSSFLGMVILYIAAFFLYRT